MQLTKSAESYGKMCKRGQGWTLDFFASAIVISFLLLVAILSWNFLVIRWTNIQQYNELQTAAVFASESLVASKGVPTSWENVAQGNEQSIISLGLVDERNLLNNRKLDRMRNISQTNYTMFKQKLLVSRYQLYINISNSNRTITHYELGQRMQENQTVYVERLALMNNSTVIIGVGVWR